MWILDGASQGLRIAKRISRIVGSLANKTFRVDRKPTAFMLLPYVVMVDVSTENMRRAFIAKKILGYRCSSFDD